MANYCDKNLKDSEFKVPLNALGDVLAELTQPCLSTFSGRTLLCIFNFIYLHMSRDLYILFPVPDENKVQWNDD